MSIESIRAALETQLATLTPALDTVHENEAYAPTDGVPYQRVDLLIAQPDSPLMGAGRREQGIMQVTLRYPRGDGARDITARAEAIRDAFPKGAEFAAGSYRVTIFDSPYLGNGFDSEQRWCVPVRVFWHSNFIF